ncbi:hypothetical protein HW845_35340 [Streptomyces sp. ND05-3B]|nr:hypothetical protein [Streptomyces caniscabiei]MBE4758966.1 hypothetical protein [Streptomyces caniscabiei]MBE4772835.1 hypothetical protein [Streptomyces caniscabiei]MBE4788276.1 hypothetical protein [Streptomyces caniscabiei]MBE4797515.1 hypothetical protein [Streptomyces caniscabiei]
MKVQRMKRRTATLAAAGMAAGALFAIAVPGTAEAQSGSRICGNYWKGYYNKGQQEVIWSRVIEVPKSDGVSCQRAMDRTDKVGNPPSELTRLGVTWGSRQRLHNVTCEWFSQDLFNAKYGDDVCNSMQRADNVWQVNGRTISQFWYK